MRCGETAIKLRLQMHARALLLLLLAAGRAIAEVPATEIVQTFLHEALDASLTPYAPGSARLSSARPQAETGHACFDAVQSCGFPTIRNVVNRPAWFNSLPLPPPDLWRTLNPLSIRWLLPAFKPATDSDSGVLIQSTQTAHK